MGDNHEGWRLNILVLFDTHTLSLSLALSLYSSFFLSSAFSFVFFTLSSPSAGAAADAVGFSWRAIFGRVPHRARQRSCRHGCAGPALTGERI